MTVLELMVALQNESPDDAVFVFVDGALPPLYAIERIDRFENEVIRQTRVMIVARENR
jgi:hypothetical protein